MSLNRSYIHHNNKRLEPETCPFGSHPVFMLTRATGNMWELLFSCKCRKRWETRPYTRFLCITLVLEVTSRVTCLLEVLARLFWLKVPGQNTPLLICWLDIRWPRCMVAIEWANLEWFDIVVLWIIFTTTFTLWHLTKWVTTSEIKGGEDRHNQDIHATIGSIHHHL